MITIDLTLLLHIISIIALMVALNVVLYKPVLGILEKRAQHMETLQAEVTGFESSSLAQKAELDRKMREASARAKKSLDEAKAQAQATGAEQLARIRALADEDKKQALDSTRAQVETARKALEAETADFARAMAEKILGRSLKA